MIRIVYKKPEQDAEILTYNTSEEFNLDEIQKLVDGYFEPVTFAFNKKNITFYCNEEGRLKGLPINILLKSDGGYFDVICGPVIFVSNRFDEEGNSLDLTKKEIDLILDYCNLADVRLYMTKENEYDD